MNASPASVTRAVAQLAEFVAVKVPDTGRFDAIEADVQIDDPTWDLGRVVLRIAPYPTPNGDADPAQRRCVLVEVATRSGASTSSRWLTAGRNQEILRFLSALGVVEQVRTAITELVDSQRRHELS